MQQVNGAGKKEVMHARITESNSARWFSSSSCGNCLSITEVICMAGKKCIESHELQLQFKRFPPDFSSLGSLGFDSVTVSRAGAVLKKTHGSDMAGRPHLFTEIEIKKDRATVRYSCPQGSHPEIRRMQCSLLLMRVLSLFPGLCVGCQPLCGLLLPTLESTERIAGSSYELLAKKNADLQDELSMLSSKNRQLLLAGEESASACIALEQRVSALQRRLERLSSVPDTALRELVSDWVSSHKGVFNVAAFSEAHRILPARCEEGLEMLLLDGTLQPIGNGNYSVLKNSHERVYSSSHESGSGPMRLLRRLSGGLVKK